MPTSQLFRPGPEKNRRLAVPSVPRSPELKSDVLKYGCPWRGSVMLSGPGVKFGVSMGSEIAPAPLVPSSELSSVSTRVTGSPVENLVMPLNLHPLTKPARSAKEIEGQLVVVADDEVVPHVERGERMLARVEQIDLLAVSRTIVQRLGVGVAGEKFQAGDLLAHTHLQRVVAGLAAGDEVAIAGEVRPERPARAVDGASGDGVYTPFSPLGPQATAVGNLAQLADAQAKRGIARVGFKRRQQVMSLRSHIAALKQGRRTQVVAQIDS